MGKDKSAAKPGLLGRLFAPPDWDADDPLLPPSSDDPRSGSALAPGARPTTANSTSVAPRALNNVMAELRTLGDADPAVQAKLMEDLQRTDPSLWPLVTQTYRNTLAFKQRTARPSSVAGRPAEATTASADRSVLLGSTPSDTAITPTATAISISAAPAPLVAVAPPNANPPRPVLTATVAPATGGAVGEPPLFSAAAPTGAANSAASSALAANNLTAATTGRSPIELVSYAAPIAGSTTAVQSPVGPAAAPASSAVPIDVAAIAGTLAAIEADATTPAGAARAALVKQQVDAAAARLADLSPLALTQLTFCSEVTSFGVVTPFTSNEFAAGQPVLLYAEVENFKSQPVQQGFRTALKSSYQILDAGGRRISGTEPQLMEETCHTPRRDYFLRYRLNLPAGLAAGSYTLQLSIEDTLSQKSAVSSIVFSINSK